MRPGISRVRGGVDVSTRYHRSEFGAGGVRGDRLPVTCYIHCFLHPCVSRVYGSIYVTTIYHRGEFTSVGGGGYRIPRACSIKCFLHPRTTLKYAGCLCSVTYSINSKICKRTNRSRRKVDSTCIGYGKCSSFDVLI